MPPLLEIVTVVNRVSHLKAGYNHLLGDLDISAVMRLLLLWSAGPVWSMTLYGFTSRVSLHEEHVEVRLAVSFAVRGPLV